MDDPARRRIDDPGRDMQHRDAGRAEGEIDQRMRRLGGEAALPVGLADPVAELQPALLGVQPGAADEGAGAGERQRVDGAGLRRSRVMAMKARASASP